MHTQFFSVFISKLDIEWVNELCCALPSKMVIYCVEVISARADLSIHKNFVEMMHFHTVS